MKNTNKFKNRNICFFTSIKFSFIAIDIAKNLKISNLHLINNGSTSFHRSMLTNAGKSLKSSLHLNLIIEKLLDDIKKKSFTKQDLFLINDQLITPFDDKYGLGFMSELISADRHFGRGFVHGAHIRPYRIFTKYNSLNSTLKQLFIVKLADIIEEYIRSNKLSLVFIYSIAGLPALLIAKICNIHSIKFFHPVHTRVGAQYILDSSPVSKLDIIDKELLDTKLKFSDKNNFELANSFINNSLDSRFLPDYTSLNDKYTSANKIFIFSDLDIKKINFLIGQIKISFKSTLGIFYYLLLFEKFSYKFEQLKRQLYKIQTAIRSVYPLYIQKYENVDSINKFIYFPLHIDPEASTMILTPFLTNQIWVIETISKNMPSGFTLVVKEHRPMLGRRRNQFYKTISNIPRVCLVDPFVMSNELISKSSLVCSISGTVIQEALLSNRNFLLIGDAPFAKILSPHVWDGNIYTLKKFIINSINNKKVSKRKIFKYYYLLFKHSIKLPSFFLWGEYKDININMRKKIVNLISSQLKKYI